MTEEKYYVYRHIRKDKNVPFYIGIGSKEKEFNSISKEFSRAYNISSRSNPWKGIISKSDYRVDILYETNDRQEALNKEIEFISLYGRIDLGTGSLINFTGGGEGLNDYEHSEEYKNKMSKVMKDRYLNNTAPIHPTKEVVNIETGIFYDSIKDAHKTLSNISYSHFVSMLSGKYTNTTNFLKLN